MKNNRKKKLIFGIDYFFVTSETGVTKTNH